MALRLCGRRIASTGIRSLSSHASAPASNLSQDVKASITRDASLPNPDPAEDSASAALVNEHSAYMLATYARPPPVFVKGEGSYLWDLENRKYLDFTSGIAVNGLGHCDPGLSKLIAQQATTLWHASNLYYNPWTGALSQLLVQKTLESGGMHDAATVFVCNSGTEANEAAIKFARKSGKVLDPEGAKHEIVSFQGSFHGRTMGSLSATPNPKYQDPFAPMIPGFKYGTLNDVGAINDLVTEQTCGVIIEPIQGEGGVNVATEEFLVALAKRCREVGAVLIYDEIQCGMSRTGALWAHSSLPKEAHPDVITTAKALGNGFPIGAVVVNRDVSEKMKVGDHGTTFGGNPMACRLAHYVVSRLTDPELQKGVLEKSNIFMQRFEKLRQQYPDLITEIRGKGLILGVQLTQDPSPIVKAARERGLLVITCGTNTLSLDLKADEKQRPANLAGDPFVTPCRSAREGAGRCDARFSSYPWYVATADVLPGQGHALHSSAIGVFLVHGQLDVLGAGQTPRRGRGMKKADLLYVDTQTRCLRKIFTQRSAYKQQQCRPLSFWSGTSRAGVPETGWVKFIRGRPMEIWMGESHDHNITPKPDPTNPTPNEPAKSHANHHAPASERTEPPRTVLPAPTPHRRAQPTALDDAREGRGDASVVPKVQEKLLEGAERAVPNALHDTGDK
ncbi:hypothetical protein DL766_000380 [Monosporascus sp. MC13-8B]|uniref:acetylornithine transaminase n=1 Tax=Monosporascus cannonballus TaxID=155416 RepID=A0ABY0HFQ5_9PEZI|nr:hypothetical protein DL762_001690 [Monosporascus cannonballus]RYO99960.1 hypothetical protein DL763_001091 [Monosporascus cannonballus]RYP39558.1 hypothetical protein DL766_000380 [Monosporascus sp. MC13-8B]